MSFELHPEKNSGSKGFEINENFLPEDNEAPEEPKEKKSISAEIIEWLEVISTAVIAVVIIFCFIFRIATISGDSMKNTLYSGEKVVISNLAYTPKNGDIVVISRNAENSVAGQASSQGPIIKRVIATGGQTVDIDFETGIVYVDGKALKENYTSSPTVNKADVEFPLYIPEGYIFVLGDNRSESLDSRYSQIGEDGLIDTRYVLGHAVFRIFPFDRIGRLDNK